MYLRSNVIYIFVCLSNAHVLPYDQKWNNYVVVKRGNQLLCAPKSSFSYVHYSEGRSSEIILEDQSEKESEDERQQKENSEEKSDNPRVEKGQDELSEENIQGQI